MKGNMFLTVAKPLAPGLLIVAWGGTGAPANERQAENSRWVPAPGKSRSGSLWAGRLSGGLQGIRAGTPSRKMADEPAESFEERALRPRIRQVFPRAPFTFLPFLEIVTQLNPQTTQCGRRGSFGSSPSCRQGPRPTFPYRFAAAAFLSVLLLGASAAAGPEGSIPTEPQPTEPQPTEPQPTEPSEPHAAPESAEPANSTGEGAPPPGPEEETPEEASGEDPASAPTASGPLAHALPALPPAAAPPAHPPETSPAITEIRYTAEVVEVNPPFVVVDLGAEDGVEKGDSITIFPGEDPSGEELVVVGEVTSVQRRRATVILGMGEPRPPPGSEAFLSDQRPTGRLLTPHLGAYRGSVDAIVRVGAAPEGMSFVSEVRAKARAGVWQFGADLNPLAVGDQGSVIYHVGGFFGPQFHAFGILAKAGTLSMKPSFQPRGSALAFGVEVRLGSEDGINLVLSGDLGVLRQRVEFAQFRFAGQIPLARRAALLMTFNAGQLGYTLIEGGFRYLAFGDGGAQTLLLRSTFGGSEVYADGVSRELGFQVGLGAEYRF